MSKSPKSCHRSFQKEGKTTFKVDCHIISFENISKPVQTNNNNNIKAYIDATKLLFEAIMRTELYFVSVLTGVLVKAPRGSTLNK